MTPGEKSKFSLYQRQLLRSFFYFIYLIVNLFITIGEISQKIVLFPFIHLPRWGAYILPLVKTLVIFFFHVIQKLVSFIVWIILLPYRIFTALFSREFRFAILGFLICLIVISLYLAYLFVVQLPSPKSIGKVNFAQSTHLYDRNGKLLYEIYRDENRTPIKVNELPAYIKQAAIAIEDKDFSNTTVFPYQAVSCVPSAKP